MRRVPVAAAILLGGALTACGPEVEPVELYVSSLDFSDVEGFDNRHHYEISGDEFDDPHVLVEDRVWAVGTPEVVLADDRRLNAALNEPAPYTRGTPMVITAGFGAVDPSVASVAVTAVGRLVSQTDEAWAPIELFSVNETVGLQDSLTVQTAPLPTRVDLYALEIAWTVAAGEETSEFTTRTEVPTTWRRPMDGVPRYRRAFVWSARFAAGEWPEPDSLDPEALVEAEKALADRMLSGFLTLAEDVGKSYGGFPRPDYDGYVDGVDVFLDFPRTACGEFKHGLMALIEYQGVDAKWAVLEFIAPAADKYSQYVTYDVPALGRDSQVWYHTNHAFVTVHGAVFDPTYDGRADSVADYEDQLFAQFCYGQDEPCLYTSDWCANAPKSNVHCIDNPPGRSEDLGFMLFVGDSYR